MIDYILNIINNLEKEKADLMAEIVNLKQELRNSKLSMDVVRNNDNVEVSNVDVIRRLSQLEKLVYSNMREKEERENN